MEMIILLQILIALAQLCSNFTDCVAPPPTVCVHCVDRYIVSDASPDKKEPLSEPTPITDLSQEEVGHLLQVITRRAQFPGTLWQLDNLARSSVQADLQLLEDLCAHVQTYMIFC